MSSKRNNISIATTMSQLTCGGLLLSLHVWTWLEMVTYAVNATNVFPILNYPAFEHESN